MNNVLTISQEEMIERVMKAVRTTKFFTVTYRKDDGSLRTLNGRGRVRTYKLGNPGRAWNPEPTGRVFMWDRQKGAYRTVNAKRTIEATIDGVTYKTRGEILYSTEGEVVYTTEGKAITPERI